MDSNLVLSSSTDSAETVTAAARNQEQQARVAAPVPDVQQLDGSQVVSVEDGNSSRIQLERLLSEADELTADSSNGQINEQFNESGDRDESGDATDATAEPATLLPRDHEHYERAQRVIDYYGPETYQRIAAPGLEAMQAGLDINPGLVPAIADLENSGEVVLELLKDPQSIVWLNEQLPGEAKKAIQKISEWVATRASRAQEEADEERPRSKAPAPIRPLSGSSTKSSVPMDELPYQEYRRLRDQQSKNRYKR